MHQCLKNEVKSPRSEDLGSPYVGSALLICKCKCTVFVYVYVNGTQDCIIDTVNTTTVVVLFLYLWI